MTRSRRALAIALLAGVLPSAGGAQAGAAARSRAAAPPAPSPGSDTSAGTLTRVAGLLVGHETLAARPTGCTVILAPRGAVAGVDVRGAAPGTRETDLLRPENLVQQVHAIVLAGGSAFGLDAASGVVRWLEERRIGFDVGVARVPIVPAAILFDLGVGDARIRPDAACGYAAAARASDAPVPEGDVGAGAGATVGKLAGPGRAMKGGLGSAAITLGDGTVVAALAAVNAYGDVIDPASGSVVAGVRTPDGRGLADARRLLRGDTAARRPFGPEPQPPADGAGANTTLVVVATNATLTKVEATKVAQMAHDGLARALAPVHTPFDGDVVFALATGTKPGPADVGRLGALAADAAALAIVRGARASRGLPGLPAAGQLPPR
ncbi:MAG: P1 family peptidase [Gemmatimonadota bacterium]